VTLTSCGSLEMESLSFSTLLPPAPREEVGVVGVVGMMVGLRGKELKSEFTAVAIETRDYARCTIRLLDALASFASCTPDSPKQTFCGISQHKSFHGTGSNFLPINDVCTFCTRNPRRSEKRF
jgi:hypothetical protein